MAAPTPIAPGDFETARGRLQDEITLLQSIWNEYRYLYASGDERIELLNVTGSWFFGLAQRVFIRELLVGISRLTDPPRMGIYENLTIAWLLEDPGLRSDPDKVSCIKSKVDNAIRLAQPVREHRDRYIAHLDRELALAKKPQLSALPEAAVDNAVTALEAAYNEYLKITRGSDLDFGVHSLKNAKALVGILEDSKRWKWWQEQERANPSY